jgi:hypothetical protein
VTARKRNELESEAVAVAIVNRLERRHCTVNEWAGTVRDLHGNLLVYLSDTWVAVPYGSEFNWLAPPAIA